MFTYLRHFLREFSQKIRYIGWFFSFGFIVFLSLWGLVGWQYFGVHWVQVLGHFGHQIAAAHLSIFAGLVAALEPYHMPGSELRLTLLDIARAGGVAALISAALTALLAWGIGDTIRKKYQRKHILRGAEEVPLSVVARQARKAGSRIAWRLDPKGSAGCNLLPFPQQNEPTHVMLVGASGSGKTQLLYPAIEAAIEATNDPSVRVVVFDPKPNYLQALFDEQKDLLFNPFDGRSIQVTITNQINDLADLDLFVRSTIPDAPGIGGNESFFRDSARTLLEEITKKAVRAGASNTRFFLMLSQPIEGLKKLLKGTKAASLLEGSGNSAADIIKTMSTHIKWIEHLPDGDFIVDDWVQQKMDPDPGVLFLPAPEHLRGMLAAPHAFVLQLIARSLMSLPDDPNRRMFFFLDEFTSLTRIDKVIDLVKFARSKGASCWFGCQDFAQVRKLYGAEHTITLLNSCSSQFILRQNGEESAEALSKRIGERETREFRRNVSFGEEGQEEQNGNRKRNSRERENESISEFVTRERAVLPAELLHLEQLRFYGIYPDVHGYFQGKLKWQPVPDGGIPGFVPGDVIARGLKRAPEEDEQIAEHEKTQEKLVEAEVRRRARAAAAAEKSL
jgi:hypothetical protein